MHRLQHPVTTIKVYVPVTAKRVMRARVSQTVPHTIRQAELVNVQQIEKLDMSYAGTIQMKMRNGDVTYVSRRCGRKIKEVLR